MFFFQRVYLEGFLTGWLSSRGLLFGGLLEGLLSVGLLSGELLFGGPLSGELLSGGLYQYIFFLFLKF